MTDLRVVVIAGSQNAGSQSAKVAGEIRTRLSAAKAVADVRLTDLADKPLPFLGQDVDADAMSAVDDLGRALRAADALVVVTPEWHGMATAAIKNFFLHFSRGQLAHKPGLIATVSASMGGAYPVAELRTSSYKNSRICYLPEHLIVRNVGSVFNADGDNDESAQAYLSARLDYCLSMLVAYAGGFRTIRAGLPDGSDYPNGM